MTIHHNMHMMSTTGRQARNRDLQQLLIVQHEEFAATTHCLRQITTCCGDCPQSWAHATINVQLTGASWTERVAQLPTPSVRTCCNSQICGKTHSGTMCRHGNYEVPGGDSQDTPPASSAAPKTTEHHQHSHVRVADGHIGPLRARPPPPRLGARAAHSSNEQSYVPTRQAHGLTTTA